jgi:hypothetical protein
MADEFDDDVNWKDLVGDPPIRKTLQDLIEPYYQEALWHATLKEINKMTAIMGDESQWSNFPRDIQETLIARLKTFVEGLEACHRQRLLNKNQPTPT